MIILLINTLKHKYELDLLLKIRTFRYLIYKFYNLSNFNILNKTKNNVKVMIL